MVTRFVAGFVAVRAQKVGRLIKNALERPEFLPFVFLPHAVFVALHVPNVRARLVSLHYEDKDK